jgi:hypothetical protein
LKRKASRGRKRGSKEVDEVPKKIKTKELVVNPKGIIDSFTNNLESIRVFISNVEPVASAYDEQVLKKIETAKSKIKEIISSAEEKISANIKSTPIKKRDFPKERVEQAAEDIIKVLIDYRKLPRITIAQVELLYKSSFVMLTSFFDYLLYDIIHCYYKLFPASLSEELSINLSELKLCADRDEAIDVILDKKVDSLLREGLKKQKLFLKNELEINLKEEIINWDIINEAIERRNIIVHNNSIVNKRYLRNVNLLVVPEERKAIKEGEQLSVTTEYFKRAYDEIFITGVVLAQGCWRKWMRDDVNNADKNLINSIIFGLLLREEWGVAERVGFFSKDIKVYDAASRYILDINYCQSLKWQGEKAELSKELNKFDESNLSPRFMVALSALKGDKDGFYKNMEKAAAIGEMTQEDFYEWPLFRELRQDVKYEERIKKAFSKKNKAVKND